MISFNSDYTEGCHPRLLETLCLTNFEQTTGYGEDDYCTLARQSIKKALDCPSCDVHFLVGGTQTNTALIAHALRPWQGVIAADSGHIAVHETGAIEATGHKILITPPVLGKITPEAITAVVEAHTDCHMVEPKLVYLSQATEIGTLYTKDELTAIRRVCDTYGLYLYLDGARLAMALAADGNDLTLQDLPKLCDAFYIGGTKCGALFGEALVLVNPALKENFLFTQKQRGALFAKGRLLGLQFHDLFKDNLYFEIGEQANAMGRQLETLFRSLGFEFFVDSPTNQIFPMIPNALLPELAEICIFQKWAPDTQGTGFTPCRFVTSWATTEDMVAAFSADLRRRINP